MTVPMVHFWTMMAIQATVFFCVYVSKGRSLPLSAMPRIALLGTVFGVVFDIVVGRAFGVFSYDLAFGLPFLVLNGAVSYGLMMASVYLLRNESFLRFYIWIALIGLAYEIGNYYCGVWRWNFPGSVGFQESILIFAAYWWLAALMAIALRIVLGVRFLSLPYLS